MHSRCGSCTAQATSGSNNVTHDVAGKSAEQPDQEQTQGDDRDACSEQNGKKSCDASASLFMRFPPTESLAVRSTMTATVLQIDFAT